MGMSFVFQVFKQKDKLKLWVVYQTTDTAITQAMPLKQWQQDENSFEKKMSNVLTKNTNYCFKLLVLSHQRQVKVLENKSKK